MSDPKDYLSLIPQTLDKLLTRLGVELKQIASNRLLEYQAEEYRRNLLCKTIIHRVEPKPLDEFYQPLYIHTERKLNTKRSTISASALFKDLKYLTIFGGAGSGKSTIVRYLIVNCIRERYKFPLKVELRYLNDYQGSITDYIYKEIFQFQRLGFSDDNIHRLLDSDQFVFFFDGYDELSSSIRTRTTKDIDEFVRKYSKNRFLITSRPYTSIDMLPLFHNYSVCELEKSEIESFVRKQIRKDDEELSNKIVSAIFLEKNFSFRSFLSNPLLLSMFILTFQSYSEVPQKKSEFYHKVFEALFTTHDSVTKFAFVREKVSKLPKEHFEEVLQMFSFLSYFDEKFVFSPDYLDEKLSKIKSKKRHLSFDNNKFLEDAKVAIGILSEEGLDYVFPHRSLQEYFAAKFISGLGEENKKIIYKKIFPKFDSFNIDLFEKLHFWELLSELDYVGLNRYISLNIVEGVYSALMPRKRISKDRYYREYGKILCVCVIFLGEKGIDCKLTRLFDSSESHYTFIDSDSDIVSLIEVGNVPLTEDNLGVIISRMKHLVKNGTEIIEELEELLREDDESDHEIISLLD